MTRTLLTFVGFVTLVVGSVGCFHIEPGDQHGFSSGTDSSDIETSTESDTESETEPAPLHHAPLYLQQDPPSAEGVEYQYDGVDILIVMDNSGSMEEEQGRFEAASFSLLSGLRGAAVDWPYPPMEDARIGVVTTDLGLSYGTEGQFVPPQEYSIPGCNGHGDDGSLQANTMMPAAIPSDEIPCWGAPLDCPAGWTCEAAAPEALATCQAPIDFEMLACHASNIWVETADGATGDDHPAEDAVCALQVGIDGCGMEQPLSSMAHALEFYIDTFVRRDALLVVLLVTDENDCSFDDPAIFETPAFADLGLKQLNVGCYLHEQLLADAPDFRRRLVEMKQDDARGVLFGAIAGVPLGVTCEGAGHQIDDCQGSDAMQFVSQENQMGQFVPRPSCELIVDDVTLTSASPPQRIVSLIQEFQEYGYAYSICRDDYHGAMTDFSKQILRAMLPFEPLSTQ